MSNGDQLPEVAPVTTPDEKMRAQLEDAGHRKSGLVENFWAALWAGVDTAILAIMTALADVFDNVMAKIVPFLTASQGTTTDGFYNLTASLINDLLGVEVAGADLSQAANDRGRIGAMQQVGADLLISLANEFAGQDAAAGPGSGPGGLPGEPGARLTPEQGVKAAQAFIGFALSFAVRQGNVAVLTDAISLHLLQEVREYGEMMAKNLGLGRLVRRALQPIIQVMISQPLTNALNQQYRPHLVDPRQLATAFLRGNISKDRYKADLALHGYTDVDADLLIEDTAQRIPLGDLFLLHETGALDDNTYALRVSDLGYRGEDFTLLNATENLRAVQREDRAFAALLATDLANGVLTQGDFDTAIQTLRLPKLETDAITRNAAHRRFAKRKQLALQFLKRAYLDATITIDEYLVHAGLLGFNQDDRDILEAELLFEQATAKDKAAAKARHVAAKAAGKATPTIPQPAPPAPVPPKPAA